MNFQWETTGLDALCENVLSKTPDSIYLDLESKEYQCGEILKKQRQFIIQDLDGYLFRFCD